jgi:hypothetical protein
MHVAIIALPFAGFIRRRAVQTVAVLCVGFPSAGVPLWRLNAHMLVYISYLI